VILNCCALCDLLHKAQRYNSSAARSMDNAPLMSRFMANKKRGGSNLSIIK
jgi:hypothetical protein